MSAFIAPAIATATLHVVRCLELFLDDPSLTTRVTEHQQEGNILCMGKRTATNSYSPLLVLYCLDSYLPFTDISMYRT